MEFDYPCSNVWSLTCEPMEELTDEQDLEMWGTLEENNSEELEEDYE